MKEIKLPKGYVALVDNKDYKSLSGYKWSISGRGYAFTCVKGKFIWMHKLLLNVESNKQVDHINRNKLDNTRKNLRVCSVAENCRNRGKRVDNKSGYKGVSFDRTYSKWRSFIWVP